MIVFLGSLAIAAILVATSLASMAWFAHKKGFLYRCGSNS